VGCDDSAREAIATVKAHSVTTCRAVHFDLASIRLEAFCGVLGGDTALDGETAGGDTILGEA